MPVERRIMLGAPYAYHVSGRTALEQPVLAREGVAADALDLLERLRRAFDLRLYAYAFTATGYRLVLRHQGMLVDSDARLRERWALLGSRTVPASARLRARLTSLSGVMQTFLQRLARAHNARAGTTGSIWAGRYRACLLADDAAICAAIAAVGQEPGDAATMTNSSRRNAGVPGDPVLSPPPFTATPAGEIIFADEAPRGLVARPATADGAVLSLLLDEFEPQDLDAYNDALQRGWALGRPESLTDALARLDRGGGRGRRRQRHELFDSLGLCAVWG
ncbi:MAG: hypothetical protein ACOCYP_02570 [Planctomycetota bacterium]